MSTSHTQKQAKQNRTEQNLSVIVFIITILLGENAKGKHKCTNYLKQERNVDEIVLF